MTVRVYIITGQPRRMRPNKIYETQRMDNLKKKNTGKLALVPSPPSQLYCKLVVHPSKVLLYRLSRLLYLHQCPGEVLQRTLFWNNAQYGQAGLMWESSLVTISMAQFDLLMIKKKHVGTIEQGALFGIRSVVIVIACNFFSVQKQNVCN